MNQKKHYLAEVSQYIPSAAQTLSKNPSQYVIGVTPVAIREAHGVELVDIEGNRYLDLILALGPMVFGYANERIDERVTEQIRRGVIYSLPAAVELDLAKVLREVVPCAEMSRFVLNGNDATSGAIRLARHVTGRDHVAKCGYHGWQDWSICTKSGRNTGVPEMLKSLTHDFTYNDLSSLERIFAEYPDQIAAVIMEPTSSEPPTPGFLEAAKELAHRHGALFIFDEMVTGFRWALGGASEYFGVVPDIACFGKAISNGYPLAAICGKAEYMRRMDEVFVSMTFGGFTLGLVAALETIAMMREYGDVHRHMHELGEYLITGANRIAQEAGLPIEFMGYGPHPVMQVKLPDLESRLVKTIIFQEMNKAGILFSSSMMIGYIHTREHMDRVLGEFKNVCSLIAGFAPEWNKLDALREGEIIAPRTVRAQQ